MTQRDFNRLDAAETTRTRARLLAGRVIDANGCWLWQGAINPHGYGITKVLGRAGWVERIHRLSWFVFTGAIPRDCILHRCDVRACFNPEHLFEGTRLDNTRDMIAKGRDRFPDPKRGEEASNVKLTETDVREIVAASLAGEPRVSLARRFRVTTTAISMIVLGKNWKHITRGCGVPKGRGGRRAHA